MAIELSTLEESVAPDGWTCHWDKYVTCNLLLLKLKKKNVLIQTYDKPCMFHNLFRRGLILLRLFKQLLEEHRELMMFNSVCIFYKG